MEFELFTMKSAEAVEPVLLFCKIIWLYVDTELCDEIKEFAGVYVSVPIFMLVAVAAPIFGVVSVGLVEKTKLVEVVPVAPEAVYPVMLLNAPIPADVAPVPPYPTATAVPCQTPEETVPSAETLPLPSKFTDFSEGYVTKTLTVPEKVTALPELLEATTVVRVSVGPVVEYVPMPTSQLPEVSVAA